MLLVEEHDFLCSYIVCVIKCVIMKLTVWHNHCGVNYTTFELNWLLAYPLATYSALTVSTSLIPFPPPPPPTPQLQGPGSTSTPVMTRSSSTKKSSNKFRYSWYVTDLDDVSPNGGTPNSEVCMLHVHHPFVAIGPKFTNM